ncbi:unnamed protein product [Sphagnum tenellum]
MAITALEMSTQEKAAARRELEEELSKRLGDEPEAIERRAELAAQGKKAETIDENSDDDWDDDNEQDDDSVRDWKVRGKQIHEPGADLSCFTV